MHKEEYFTPDNIAATAAAMAHALPINRRAAVFSLADSALLVIDMQRYFLCAGSHAFLPAAPAIIPNINRLIAVFKKAIRPVYFTRHANSMRDAGQMAVWWGELLGRDHPLGGIQNTVHTRKDPIIEKTQYDSRATPDNWSSPALQPTCAVTVRPGPPSCAVLQSLLPLMARPLGIGNCIIPA
jgi:isochorismate hydrolase